MKKTYRLFLIAVAISAIAACSNKNEPDNGPDPQAAEISLPEDPAPSGTNFKKKLLIVDFTGNKCPYCPNMTRVLRSVRSNTSYKNSTILAVAHTYNDDDPAYLNSNLDNLMGVSKYPTLVFDLFEDWKLGYSESLDANTLQNQIDIQIRRNPATAGICAASAINDGTVTIKAGVKSGEEAATDYYVAVMILEDGIEAEQNNAPDDSYNTHDECIRMIEGCNGKNIAGKRLDNVLKKGECGEISFAFTLDKKIVKSNCSYVAYVSCADANGNFKVINAISAKLGESVKYQYN